MVVIFGPPHHYRPVGECLVRLCHQGWRPLAEEPPRALREVERLSRNPEKLANAGGRCWKYTLGQKWSFNPLPYPEAYFNPLPYPEAYFNPLPYPTTLVCLPLTLPHCFI